MSAASRKRVRASRESPKFRERPIFVGVCEAVHAPSFRLWIDISWFHKSAADLKSLASANPNHFVGDAILTAVPSLLVNRSVPFAGNLPVGKSVTAKLFRQGLIGMAFPTPTLSRSVRFLT